MKRHLLIRILKWAAITLAVIFIALQFIRPARTNPPVDQSRTLETHATLSPEVAATLNRACNDCHSNHTRWPWYSNVAPVSWWLTSHVDEGRKEMNFSDWAQYDQSDRERLLKKICREVTRGDMPLKSYLWLHSEAKLSSDDVKLLCDWASGEAQLLTSPTP